MRVQAVHGVLRRGTPYFRITVPAEYAQKLRMRLIRPTRTTLHY